MSAVNRLIARVDTAAQSFRNLGGEIQAVSQGITKIGGGGGGGGGGRGVKLAGGGGGAVPQLGRRDERLLPALQNIQLVLSAGFAQLAALQQAAAKSNDATTRASR